MTARPVDVAALLVQAERVIVVPGYGLAVAQGQHVLRVLADTLAARGVEVVYVVHPVAGRMPGHLNVLLDDAGVPHTQLVELDDLNADVGSGRDPGIDPGTDPGTEVVLVVGADDIVNPVAPTTPSSPLYAMPVLQLPRGRQVVVLKRSTGQGFAGVDNPLFDDPRTTLLLGDAKESLGAVLAALGLL